VLRFAVVTLPMPPATTDLTRRNRRELAWWGVVAVLVVSWLVASRVQRLQDIEATEADRLQVQVRAISQNLERQLDGVAAALRGLRADLPEWQGRDLPRRAAQRMQALRAAMPGVRTMALVDAQGVRVADSRPQDWSDAPAVTAWLQRLSMKPDSSVLYVSPPFLTLQGERAVTLAVVLMGADQSFDGAIVATLDGDYFRTLLESVLYAPDMTARIVHADLSVLVATPAEAHDARIAERVADVFGRHLSSGQPANVLRARSAYGGERLAALRTLDLPRLGMDQPLLLGVGRSLRALRLPWRQQTEIIAAAAFGALLASGLGLLALQRRRSERETAAAERVAQEHRDAERLRLALHGADLALWDVDLASGQATVNERWSTMLGYAPDEPGGGGSGSEWEALLHPDDRSRVLALQQDHLDGCSEHFEASYRLRHREGHWVWVLDRGRVVQRDAAGKPLRMVGTHLDITARVQAEDELRRGGQKSRALLAALHSGVVQHAPDGRVLDANPAACRILGLSLEQMQNKAATDPAWTFMEEDGRPMREERHPVRQVLATGAAVENLVVGLRHPHLAQTVWALCVAFPLHGADGALEEVVVTFYDITERQQGELERRALERQLREAQKIESIGTLAGGIAHDFNNILPAILGNVALARQDLAPGHPALSSLEQIHTAGQRARTLVQQILTFSRRQPQALVVQPLQPVIEETLGLLRATLPAAVKLDTAITPLTLLVEADATQLQQVVMNLCTNAWQALPEGRGRIEVGLVQREPGAGAEEGSTTSGPHAHLWVADNGSGMAPEVLDRIFDPFFTTKPVGQGTGLGLSVVHGIVRLLHGSIHVHSKPGQGTRFDLLLPLAVAGVAVVAGPAAEVDKGASPEGGGGERLLYVDDDEVMGLMVQRLLQREGYDVTGLVSPLQALALLQQDPAAFDLVISDFNMPEMSGTELAAQLRTLRPALPVLISSGYISDELRAQAAAQGVRALLQKEQTLEALPGLVRQVLAAAAV
jgi:PAS domain S-box-containing protein